MDKKKNVWTMVLFGIICLSVIAIFIFRVLPLIDSKAMSGIIGVLVGSLSIFLGTIVTSMVGMWQVTKDVEAKVKDISSRHALEITKIDYELRSKGHKRFYLAPAKVYRELYKALYELHTAGTWPKAIEELGLLRIFELGEEEEQKEGK